MSAIIGDPRFPRTKRFDMEERKRLIFNAKQRNFGVDVNALAAQKAEKQLAAAREAEYDKHHASMTAYYDKQLVLMEQERREVQAALNRNVAEFRKEHQKKEQRREYDLSDPNATRNSLPARVGDADARIGVSSAQVFEGEDLRAGERRRVQAAQQRAWCDAQQAERDAATLAEQEAEIAHGELVKQQEAYQSAVVAAQEEARRAFERDVARENAALAEEALARAIEEKHASDAAAEAEAEAVAVDATLAEDPTVGATNYLSETRVRADHWKGMRREDHLRYAAEQQAQRDAKAAAEEEEAAANRAHFAQSELVRKTLEQRAEQVEQFKLEQRAAVFNTVRAQREEKHQRDASTRRSFVENSIGPEYFGYFGNSAR